MKESSLLNLPYADQKSIFFRCVEDSSEATMICDKSGAIVYVNPAWTTIFGYTSEEAIGQTPRILQSGMHGDAFYREMWEKILDPEVGSWRGVLLNRAKDGSHVPVRLTITPYRDEKNGEISGYMAIASDQRYQYELEAKVAHRDRLASIGLLAAGLAHEIGTPLGVIRGRAEFLAMQIKIPENQRNLQVIVQEVDRISKLIHTLLKIGNPPNDLQIENLSPAQVCHDVLSLLRQNLEENQIAIHLDLPDQLTVAADRRRLEQVFLNLILNAIHAIRRARQEMPTGPRYLRITAEKTDPGRPRITVEDSGCGISSTEINKIFQPFFTTKDVGEGTGLGLTIVAQLLREMQGQIFVQSTLGQGAKFTLEFALDLK